MSDIFSTMFSWGLTNILQIAATAAVRIIVPFLANWLHLQSQDIRRGYLQDALKNALNYAISMLAKNPDNNDLIIVKNDVIAIAKEYLKTMTPTALAKLGLKDD